MPSRAGVDFGVSKVVRVAKVERGRVRVAKVERGRDPGGGGEGLVVARMARACAEACPSLPRE